MTPAEAREIDRLEFEAECKAIRQRAYALVQRAPIAAPATAPLCEETEDKQTSGPKSKIYKHAGRAMTIRDWAKHLGIDANVIGSRLRRGWTVERALTSPITKGAHPTDYITHNGMTMSVREWAEHLGVKQNTLWVRLARGMPIHVALSANRLPRNSIKTRAYRGVASNSGAFVGTGAGSTAQDTSNIDFHKKANINE